MRCEQKHALKIIDSSGYRTIYRCQVCFKIIIEYSKYYTRIGGNIIEVEGENDHKNTAKINS